MAHAHTASRFISSRLLGLTGMLGGVALLEPFLPFDIDAGFDGFRIILFNIGTIAIVIGVHRRQASAAPVLTLVGGVPALIANGWHLAMVVLATGRPEPFAGYFGLVYFFAAVAMWLTDAAFGLVTLRLGVVHRWGPTAIAIGSALAITGIDRLGLTSAEAPTFFGLIALAGLALAGLGWILLGLDVATRLSDVDAQSRSTV